MIDGFFFLEDISKKKENVLELNPELEEEYSPIFVNRGLSQHLDTIFFANEMNSRWADLDHKLQFDYLFHAVRKSSRYGKWVKKTPENDFDSPIIARYFNCSLAKAREYRKILNNKQLDEIKERMRTG
jgi:hypothetical protein